MSNTSLLDLLADDVKAIDGLLTAADDAKVEIKRRLSFLLEELWHESQKRMCGIGSNRGSIMFGGSLTEHNFSDEVLREALPDIASIEKTSFLFGLESLGMVYFLFSNDDCVYVGQTKSGFSRISSHINTKKKFNRVSFILLPTQWLNTVESFYIKTLCPQYNIAGVPNREQQACLA